ncbi:MAG: putative sulfate exporter family transporter [Candidatus Bipolaricaulota bacterium]|nr:putative sulfate exporter family transporter [Candidatus Bipolaricaulota bacterium]
MTTTRRFPTGLLVGLALVVVLTMLVAEFDTAISKAFAGRGVAQNPLEYPLVAVALGLVANALLRGTKTHAFVRPGIRTELFLKVGLVLMAAGLNITVIMKQGAGGLLQALILVTAVFLFTWWLATRFGLPPQLKAVMACAISICGVSAAIAAAGAVMAKKKEVTYVTALVIVTALPLMVLMPWMAHALGLSETVAGAWFGGNIDTTAAVVGAGTIYGETAQQVASVVKMAQNALIGVVAFLLATYFVVRIERKPDERPSAAVIWHRFPKFILGFLLVSVLASTGVLTGNTVTVLKALSKWAFAAAFICIGLELSIRELSAMGWRPTTVYLVSTVFNTALALGAASVIFGVLGL